jgi:hypothetical protein
MKTIDQIKIHINEQQYPTLVIEDLIRANHGEAQRELFSNIQTLTKTAASTQNFVELTFWSRTLFTYGRVTQNMHAQALGFYFNAYLKYLEEKYSDCIDLLTKAQSAIANSTHKQQQSQLLGSIFLMFAYAYSALGNESNAKRHVFEAKEYFTAANDVSGLDAVTEFLHRRTDVNPVSLSVKEKHLTEVTVQITERQAELQQILTQISNTKVEQDLLLRNHKKLVVDLDAVIAAKRREVEVVNMQLSELASTHAQKLTDFEQEFAAQSLVQHQRIIDAELSANVSVDRLREQTLENEARIQAADEATQQHVETCTAARAYADSQLKTARDSLVAPLWVQLARAELQAGQVHADTYAMLDRLCAYEPLAAQHLFIELQARSGKRPVAPYTLTEFSGETRLLAARVNAKLLLTTNKHAALELLIEEWERYLEVLL